MRAIATLTAITLTGCSFEWPEPEEPEPPPPMEDSSADMTTVAVLGAIAFGIIVVGGIALARGRRPQEAPPESSPTFYCSYAEEPTLGTCWRTAADCEARREALDALGLVADACVADAGALCVRAEHVDGGGLVESCAPSAQACFRRRDELVDERGYRAIGRCEAATH